jgi:hypothetical protein
MVMILVYDFVILWNFSHSIFKLLELKMLNVNMYIERGDSTLKPKAKM